MKWQDIDGWFNEGDAKVYHKFVESVPDGGIILEIGAYKGRSTMCLAQTIEASGKDIKIVVVDTFEGDKHIGEAKTKDEFLANMKPYERFIKELCVGYSTDFAGELGYMLDAVYIDASHDYKSVREDIDSWLPHVNIGGFMGGHDYNWTSVHRAVNETFDNVQVFGNSWFVNL